VNIHQNTQRFTQDAGIELPIIGGAMYPCSNPELVAAISATGAIGIIQPISLTYVHGYEFRQGIQYIRSLTKKPIGMNVLIEGHSKKYRTRMQHWIEIALEEGIRFFITSLGKPDWVTAQVQATDGKVYHDVTEHKWASKGIDANVDGLIAVNDRAGGHAGNKSPEQLYQELAEFSVPVICAGGISTLEGFTHALQTGYGGIQMGTRFIATHECNTSTAYKQAIVNANENDIVLSQRITGVPVAIINTTQAKPSTYKVSRISRWLLNYQHTKHFIRTIYALQSIWQLKRAAFSDKQQQTYWQAGKSVAGIQSIVSTDTIINEFAQAYQKITFERSF